MTTFLQQLVNGLSLGAIYALIALGFALVFSVLRMMNFAHGDTYMLGVFVVLSMLNTRVPVPVAVAVGAATGSLVAVAVERIAYRPLRDSHPMMPIITAIVSAVILRQIVVLIWGVQTLSFPQTLAVPIALGPVSVSGTQLLTLGIAIVTALAFRVFLARTRWGRAIILMRQDLEVASLMGIPVNRMVSIVYALGGLLGVIGGLLFVTNYGAISAQMGINGTINGFIAAVMGGLGGLEAALVGGLVLGLVEQFSAAYISSSYQQAIAFGVLIAILLVRPNGLLPGRLVQKRV